MSIIKIISLFVAGMLMSSCSIYMAANQSGRRDLEVVTEGTPQSLVRAELGNPVWSGKDSQGFDVEVFQFVQGYSGGARAARVLWHTAADTFSLGLWELIGFPIESKYSGTKMNVIVTYDEQQRVKSGKLRDEYDREIPLKKKGEEETHSRSVPKASLHSPVILSNPAVSFDWLRTNGLDLALASSRTL